VAYSKTEALLDVVRSFGGRRLIWGLNLVQDIVGT